MSTDWHGVERSQLTGSEILPVPWGWYASGDTDQSSLKPDCV